METNCPHPSRLIDGIWRMGLHQPPMAVAWTCRICRTSGSTKWAYATREDRQQAYLAELSREAGNEMTLAADKRAGR